MTDPDATIVPPPPIWRRWLWLGGGVLALVAVLVIALVVVPLIAERANRCGPGVKHTGAHGECVGVTDGAVVYNGDLEPVERLIEAENAAAGEPYVSVVVMLPMTLRDSDLVTAEWVRHQLEGAYVAQREANRVAMWGGPQPKVRLLLANPGSGFEHWRPVVEELERRRDSEHIVAVTGIGLSYGTAEEAMRALSARQMPVIGSTLTADELSDIKGFFRVSPTNGAQARAAAAYLKDRTAARSAMLVQDTNPHDLYPVTLADEFVKRFAEGGHRVIDRAQRYNTDNGGGGNLSAESAFATMTPNICAKPPDVVYFAGRSQYLGAFISALAQRNCRDTPITVMTGDDLAMYGKLGNMAQLAAEANVTVDFTGLAHPAAWELEPDEFSLESTGHFRGWSVDGRCAACFPALFPRESLDDGFALIAHDAVATAVTGARRTFRPGGPAVAATDVRAALSNMYGANEVPGVSGRISFDMVGNPIDKPVPVLQLRPDGPPTLLSLARPGA